MHDHITGNATFSKTIEIIVSPKGETQLETKGFSGTECKEASKFVELALGSAVAERLTADARQTAIGVANQGQTA